MPSRTHVALFSISSHPPFPILCSFATISVTIYTVNNLFSLVCGLLLFPPHPVHCKNKSRPKIKMPTVVIYAFEKPGDFNNLLFVYIVYGNWILFSVCVCTFYAACCLPGHETSQIQTLHTHSIILYLDNLELDRLLPRFYKISLTDVECNRTQCSSSYGHPSLDPAPPIYRLYIIPVLSMSEYHTKRNR